MGQSTNAPRVALYVRVSTGQQTIANQLHELHAVGDRLGWQITKVYSDEGISGSKGRDQRPGFNDLLKAITRREVDLVAAWDASRLSRSMKDLVNFLDELK